jgi:hypothetical protein
LSQALASHGTALWYDPPLRGSASNEKELKIAILRAAPRQRASSEREVVSFNVLVPEKDFPGPAEGFRYSHHQQTHQLRQSLRLNGCLSSSNR